MSQVITNPDSISIAPFVTGEENVIEPFNLLHVESSEQQEPQQQQQQQPGAVKALIILNQQINMNSALFDKIWSQTDIHVCADGGSNRLYQYNTKYTPDYIIGDLDSITDETRDFYRKNNCPVILQSSQFYTDLDKALTLINLHVNFPQSKDRWDSWDRLDQFEREEAAYLKKDSGYQFQNINVVFFGAIGGRFDQTMGSIVKMGRIINFKPYITPILLNSDHDEFIILLRPGKNYIKFKRLSSEEEETMWGLKFENKSRPQLRNIGLLPLLSDSTLTTHGLKWDVENWDTSMKGNVSSCNLQVGQEGFIVENSELIFINMEF